MLRCAEGASRNLAPLRACANGAALATLMAGCSAPVLLERSFRLAAGAVAHDRFLLSVPLRAAPEGLLPALGRLGLPDAARLAAEAAWAEARFLHLGLDGNDQLKLYLEAPEGLVASGDAGALLHRAWKWRPASGELAEDRYVLVPPDQARERLALVPTLLQPALQGALAALQARPGWLFMLDVLGPRGRRSLDIRCYDFERDVGALAAPLALAAAVLAVPAAALDAALAQHRDEQLGHLAFGVGHGGAPFLTVYAGAERCDPAVLG